MKSQKKIALSNNLIKPKAHYLYGTAGYRLNTEDLNNVICRASIMAYVRSATFAGKFIGLYITASHNPAEYNGIKFIDFNGNMFEETWESYSDELVNCEDSELNTIINKLFRQNSNYSNMNEAIRGNVLIGRDTRESGVSLTENIKDVLKKFKCNVFDYELVSCPQMHFLVRKCNEKNEIVLKDSYIKHLYNNFIQLKSITQKNLEMNIDTANGISQILFNAIQENDEAENAMAELKVEILNDQSTGILNKDCGADFVKVKKQPSKIRKGSYQITASFDGDADRLVFYNYNGKIFDGDSQCVYLAYFIKSLLDLENIKSEIGIVISHYSNTGAIEFLQSQFKVVFAQTGIKNFVREAKKFDIGIYFEPNGHGSVTFSKKFLDVLGTSENSILKIMVNMFDPCIGDAFANFLVLKAILSSQEDLIKYKENFSRLLTVKIKDKNKIKVDINNLVVEPDIQKEIDMQISAYKGRGFVRPSGTEDLVRVYAECPQENQCDKLALNIAQIVYESCDGVGPYPEISYLD